jgi:SAM-dependent methyltransferase
MPEATTMTSTDAQFSGNLPQRYERYLVPLLFEPYARDLVSRVVGPAPRTVLEIAAGTGIVTRLLGAALPEARIVATDLNDGMVAIGATMAAQPSVSWQVADAMDLPFGDARFDLVLCQFGAMFFPDRVRAFAEVRRVLSPGGRFVFNVWDSLDTNIFAAEVQAAMDALFPLDPPRFFARTPHGYHDVGAIARDLGNAGFAAPEIETVTLQSHAASAGLVAAGLCEGTPLRMEIVARGGDPAAAAAHAARHLEQRFGGGPLTGTMRAHVISVRA